MWMPLDALRHNGNKTTLTHGGSVAKKATSSARLPIGAGVKRASPGPLREPFLLARFSGRTAMLLEEEDAQSQFSALDRR